MKPEQVTALLGRIEKMPKDWRHPLSVYRVLVEGVSRDEARELCMDLHLRHIAEKLGNDGWCVYRTGNDQWAISTAGSTNIGYVPTYPEALISAAEEVNKSAGVVKEEG